MSNTADLCHWGEQLFRGDLLEQKSKELMVAITPLSKELDPYGLGVQISERGGRTAVGHTGSTMGFNGELFLDASSGVCVAVQTNDFLGSHEAVALPLWDALAAAGY